MTFLLKKLREKVRTVLEATSYARNTNTLGESCFAQLFYPALCLGLASFRFRFLVRARFPSDVISLALLRLYCSFVYILTVGQFLFVTISQPDFNSRFVYIYLLVYLFPNKGNAVRLVIVCGAIIEIGHLLDLIFQSSSTCVLRVKG